MRRARRQRLRRPVLHHLMLGAVLALVATRMGTLPGADAAFSGTTQTPAALTLASLTAPDPMTCTWTGTNSLSLTWTNTAPTVTSGYTAERSTSQASGYTGLTTTSGASSVTASDSNPAPPTIHWYRVAGTNGTWTGTWSSTLASNACARTITSATTASGKSSMSGVAVDSSGNVYESDPTANKILKTTPAGVLSTFAGTGTAGYSGDGGAATSATLNGPYAAIALGSTVYIADTGNNVIRKVTSGTITTVAGGGAGTACTFSGTATSVSLAQPRRLAVDTSTSRLFVDDRNNHCVRSLSGASFSQVAGTGTAGTSGDNGPAVAATIDGPGALYFTSGNLYIAEGNSFVTCKVLSA